MKKVLLTIILMVALISMLSTDKQNTDASNIPQEYILLNETECFNGEDGITIDFDFEIGDIVIFELYPQADVRGYWYSFIYTGEETKEYIYAEYFRGIDQNNVSSEFDITINENGITFTNSFFNIDRASGFWYDAEHDSDGNFIPIFPHNIDTYLRKVTVYK